MRILYVFPHPDDESFGPAPVIYKQIQEGHEVHLLTLTHGEATKMRFHYGYSKEEMGEVRFKEMECVKDVLGLTSLEVLHYPDNELAELDPRDLETTVQERIIALKPDLVVSYPVFGVSGFNDHLVMHAIIKRLFLTMQDEGYAYPRRLAFFSIAQDQIGEKSRLKPSAENLIDCEVPLSEDEHAKMGEALDCYKTYQDVINRTGVKEKFKEKVVFEIFGEDFKPPLNSLTANLPERLTG